MLDATYYADPSKLHNAPIPRSNSKIAYDLDVQLQLEFTSDYFENWSNQFNEKWIGSSSGHWYFILPTGGVYRWHPSHGKNLDQSQLIATVGPDIYVDPNGLHSAANPYDDQKTALFLDLRFGLYSTGNYQFNWSQQFDEKWIQAHSGGWYFILPNGKLYRWLPAQGTNLDQSELVAALDPSYYANPAKLHSATAQDKSMQGHSIGLDVQGGSRTLEIVPEPSFAGLLRIYVLVSDGVESDLMTFDLLVS